MQVPAASKTGSFYLQSSLFNRLNVSHAVVPCVLENNVGETAQSTQPVTLYISFNITLPNLHNSIPTEGEDEDSPTKETTIPERIQFPPPGYHSALSHPQSVETGNTIPQSREEVSLSSTKNHYLALDRADEAMKPIGQSNTWGSAVGRIKWVMDTLSPVAEVSIISFDVTGRANFQTQLFPLAKMAHGLLSAIPQARPFLSFSERDPHAIIAWMIDAPGTVST